MLSTEDIKNYREMLGGNDVKRYELFCIEPGGHTGRLEYEATDWQAEGLAEGWLEMTVDFGTGEVSID